MCQPLPWAGEGGQGIDPCLVLAYKLPQAGEDEQGEEQLTPGTSHMAH